MAIGEDSPIVASETLFDDRLGHKFIDLCLRCLRAKGEVEREGLAPDFILIVLVVCEWAMKACVGWVL